MKQKHLTGFNEYWEESLRKSPALALEYARQFAELPVSTQLGLIRYRRQISQRSVAKIEAQARAIQCRVMLVPDEMVPVVWEKLHYSKTQLKVINRLRKARSGRSA